jgi:hypothetical protein
MNYILDSLLITRKRINKKWKNKKCKNKICKNNKWENINSHVKKNKTTKKK